MAKLNIARPIMGDAPNRQSIEWRSKPIHLVELIYALYHSGSVGDVKLKDLSALCYLAASSLYGLRVASIPNSRYMFYYNDGIYYLAEGVIYSETDEGDYEIVMPEVGMIIPQLPEVNVNEIVINNKIYFEFDNMIYKQIPTQDGLMYEVIGVLEI
ncbi:MAG: DUF6515 family protein [Rikenellaceae bacterium]